MAPKVSVIIVNYNSKPYLDQCLQSLMQTQYDGPLEIIVVNNSATDGSAEMVTQKYPSVTMLDPGANLGFGVGNNYAFERCNSDYQLLVNPDATVAPTAIAESVAYMEANPNVGVMGVQFVNDDQVRQPSARMFPTVFDKFFMLSGLQAKFAHSKLFGRMDLTWWDHSHPREVDWVVGAYFMIRGSVNQQLKGFDPRFFLYFEEWDFCRRAKKLGFPVHYNPHIVIHHSAGGSSTDAESGERSGGQLTLLRLIAECLYYHKLHGRLGVTAMLGLEKAWFTLRLLKNRRDQSPAGQAKTQFMANHLELLNLALKVTRRGAHCPPHPWNPNPNAYR